MMIACIVCGKRVKRGARGKWTADWPLCPAHHEQITAIEKARVNYEERKQRYDLQQKFHRAYPEVTITDLEQNPDLIGGHRKVLTHPPRHLGVMTRKIEDALLREVDELELTVRAANVLARHNVVRVGQLVQFGVEEIGRLPNANTTTIASIIEELAKIDLSLGMVIPNWKQLCDEHRIDAPWPPHPPEPLLESDAARRNPDGSEAG